MIIRLLTCHCPGVLCEMEGVDFLYVFGFLDACYRRCALMAGYVAADVFSKFENSTWGKKLAKRALKTTQTDFERCVGSVCMSLVCSTVRTELLCGYDLGGLEWTPLEVCTLGDAGIRRLLQGRRTLQLSRRCSTSSRALQNEHCQLPI